MGLFLLTIVAWGSLVVLVFLPVARSWRIRLIGLVLLMPPGVPVVIGIAYYSRPVLFHLCRPSLESVVRELRANPKSDAWKRVASGVRRLPENGPPRQIAFCVGSGFPGYSQWYVWRADGNRPEEIFRGATARAAHWWETALN
jgi:hypothetical protein